MVDIDNFAHLVKCLPVRVGQRTGAAMRIVAPLVELLAELKR